LTRSTAASPAPSVAPHGELARDVLAGLSAPRKSLPCRWFYDAAGSRLFEEICATPEYYVTRAEDELLRDHADAIVAQAPRDATLVELGSGSAAKTQRFVAALLARQSRLRLVLIDISTAALAESTRTLRARFPALDVVTVAAEYGDGLARLDELARGPKLLLWLGSNVGNFERVAAARFLGGIRERLSSDDRLVLGVDLRKERALLEAAYDDAAGVTARFNLNLLARVNRELSADFDLAAFRHRARWEEREGRVVMELVSARAQRVVVAALGRAFDFAAGEALHTEDSFKYAPAEIDALARAAGMEVVGRWHDGARRFSENLLAPAR
jgi:dimethylhistidine N-methyltransferase